MGDMMRTFEETEKICDAIENKDKEMDNILKMREDRKQNLKINLNIDPFGDEYKKKLMKSFNFKENDIARILQSLKDGKISLDQLNALTTLGGYYDKNGNFISVNRGQNSQ